MVGVLIEEGAKPWQIFQQENGSAHIKLSGVWEYEEEEAADIFISVKNENSGEPVIWWTLCECSGHCWSKELDLPLGGLYQIETCLVIPKKSLYDIGNCEIEREKVWSEWAIRGDIISHIGVGDLYVIAGQSNSVGWAKDYIYDPCEMGVHIMKNDRQWHIAQHPLQDSTGAAITGNFDPGISGHSLYLSFAKYLKRDLNYPIGLIQTAKGGSEIEEWQPQNALFENMIDAVNQAGGKIKAILWYQGGSDVRKDRHMHYYDKFLKMKSSFEKEFGIDAIPVFVIQISKNCSGSDLESDLYYGSVREQQRRLGLLDNIYTIPSNDSSMSDFVHVSAKFNVALGERVAKSALTHLYGRNYLCDAPNIVSARKTGEKQIVLEFENVYDKLELFICAPKRLAVTVEDADGVIEIESYDINVNKLSLQLEREIGDTATVHGAYTKNLEGVIPVDYATHIPMLSFYGVKILK